MSFLFAYALGEQNKREEYEIEKKKETDVLQNKISTIRRKAKIDETNRRFKENKKEFVPYQIRGYDGEVTRTKIPMRFGLRKEIEKVVDRAHNYYNDSSVYNVIYKQDRTKLGEAFFGSLFQKNKKAFRTLKDKSVHTFGI